MVGSPTRLRHPEIRTGIYELKTITLIQYVSPVGFQLQVSVAHEAELDIRRCKRPCSLFTRNLSCGLCLAQVPVRGLFVTKYRGSSKCGQPQGWTNPSVRMTLQADQFAPSLFRTIAHIVDSSTVDSTSTINFSLQTLQLPSLIKRLSEAISCIRASQIPLRLHSLRGLGPPTREFWAE